MSITTQRGFGHMSLQTPNAQCNYDHCPKEFVHMRSKLTDPINQMVMRDQFPQS